MDRHLLLAVIFLAEIVLFDSMKTEQFDTWLQKFIEGQAKVNSKLDRAFMLQYPKTK